MVRRRVAVARVASLMVLATSLAIPVSVAASGCTEVTDQGFSGPATQGDYAWTPYAYDRAGAVGGVAIAQTATVGRAGHLVAVRLHLQARDVAGDLPVEIRSGDPGGPLLASGVLERATLQAGGWIEVRIIPEVALRRGDAVAIVLPALEPRFASGSPVQPWVNWVTGGDGYTGGGSWAGSRQRAAADVAEWSSFPNDRHFSTLVCALPGTSTAPTPARPWDAAWAAPLLALAALVGAAIGWRNGAGGSRTADSR